MDRVREFLTAQQAADYLQTNRQAIYRYIRSGRLAASRLGKSYRIAKRDLDLFLATTRTGPPVILREYTREQLGDFLRTDKLDDDAQRIAETIRRRL